MKKTISLILALVMMLSVVVSADDFEKKGFTDVSGNEYYANSALSLAELGVLTGYSDGSFGPGKTITRAEMATIVCRVMGKQVDAKKETQKPDFYDVPANHWACGFINVAVEAGVIGGDGNGRFRPGDNVRYEEAIKMIVCAFGYGDSVKSYPGDWSKGYIEVAQQKGILNSAKGSKGKASTRADVSVMLFNAVKSNKLIAYELGMPEPPKSSVKEGAYAKGKEIKLSSSTMGAKIYYTTDGTTPTMNSQKYTSSVKLTQDCTIKAIAVKNDILVSDVLSVTYTIKD